MGTPSFPGADGSFRADPQQSRFTPSRTSCLRTMSAASGSSLMKMPGAESTRDTSDPSLAKDCAITQPMGPAPMMPMRLGSAVRENRFSLVRWGTVSIPSMGGAEARAALMMALDGTEPTLRQSPPLKRPSIRAAFAPGPAAPAAVTGPAVPAPMTTRMTRILIKLDFLPETRVSLCFDAFIREVGVGFGACLDAAMNELAGLPHNHESPWRGAC